MRSVDNGATWDDGLGNVGQPRQLTTTGINHGPGAVAVNGSHIHVAWVDEVWPGPDYYIYYRNSTDNGATWSTTRLLSGPNVYSDDPTLEVYGDNVNMAWMDDRDDGVTSEIYYKNSTDGGITWSGDLRLSYNLSYHSILPRMAVANSTIHVTWFDLRHGNREVYYKRSPDFVQAQTNLSLSHGWNLVSFPVEQPKLNGTLIKRASDVYNITNCTELAIWDTGKKSNYTIYIPGFNLPTDPENFVIGEDDAIFIWWNETWDGMFNLTGYEPGPRNVSLKSGWNMVA